MDRALAASAGGFADLFSRELRGLVLLSVVLAAGLLAAVVWAVTVFVVPLIPAWAGWWGMAAELAASGAAILLTVALCLALWPLVAMVVSGLFFDVAADRLERRLPEARRGRAPDPVTGLMAGLRFASVSVPLNLLALPLYFIPVVNLVVALALNAFLLSRENFLLAGLRYGPFAAAHRALRAHRGATLLAGLPGAALSLVPGLNFVVPLWTLATMVRLRAAVAGTDLPPPAVRA